MNVGKDVATSFGFSCNSVSCINVPGIPPPRIAEPYVHSWYGSLGDADYVPLLDQNNTFQYMGLVSWSSTRKASKWARIRYAARALNHRAPIRADR